MSRYIDADAWLKNIECTNKFLDTLKHKMTDAPHIDIVRCKECKNKDTYCDYCHKLEMNIKADDYCSYGERKE